MTSIPGVLLQLPEGAIRDSSIAGNAAIQTSKLEQRVLQGEIIPLTSCRTWDAMATNLPGTSASDDLGLSTGTPGTDAIKITTGDVKASTVTRKTSFEVNVPDNYDDGETFNIQVMAGMQTTVSDGTATLDLQVFKMVGDGTISADLYTGAALSINSLTAAEKVFAITAGSLDPGDHLVCIATIAVSDAATATAVIANIYNISRACDTRG